VWDLAARGWTHLARFDRANGRGVSVEGDEFNFVSLAVGVDMDHGADIAGLQTMHRQRFRKDDSVVFSDHWLEYITRDKR